MKDKNEIIQIKKIKNGCNNYIEVYKSKFSKFSYLGNWIEKEASIFKNEILKKEKKKPNFKRGEVIKVDFGINIGSELSNVHFAIVLNKDDNNSADNITVLPLTSKKGYKRIFINNILGAFGEQYKLQKSYALITQITTISKKKIFYDNIKCLCDSKTMDILDKTIIDYLTK